MTNALLPSAIAAKKAAEQAATAMSKKRHACTSCLRDFRYGEFVMKPDGTKEILCEGCVKREHRGKGAPLQTVIFGGGEKKPSSVDKARAARNLKKMARYQKRTRKSR
jgi:hypothetical protein